MLWKIQTLFGWKFVKDLIVQCLTSLCRLCQSKCPKEKKLSSYPAREPSPRPPSGEALSGRTTEFWRPNWSSPWPSLGSSTSRPWSITPSPTTGCFGRTFQLPSLVLFHSHWKFYLSDCVHSGRRISSWLRCRNVREGGGANGARHLRHSLRGSDSLRVAEEDWIYSRWRGSSGRTSLSPDHRYRCSLRSQWDLVHRVRVTRRVHLILLHHLRHVVYDEERSQLRSRPRGIHLCLPQPLPWRRHPVPPDAAKLQKLQTLKLIENPNHNQNLLLFSVFDGSCRSILYLQ